MSATPLADPYGWPVAADPFTGLPPIYRMTFLYVICIQCASIGFTLWEIGNSFIWDVKLGLRSDWRSPRTVLMNVCYYSSRWFALAFSMVAVASITVPQQDCTILPRVYGVLAIFTVATCSAVFAWRVIALWSYQKRIMTIVGFFYLCELGWASSALVNSGGMHVLISPFCIAEFSSRPWLAGFSSSILAFDTVVMILTIYKLLTVQPVQNKLNPLRFARDRSLPTLSRLLIQQGIVYYIIATLANIVAVIFFTIKLDPEKTLYHVFWTVPGLCIQACMASKIFRLIRKELAAPATVPIVSTAHGAHSSNDEPKSMYGSTLPETYYLSRPPPAAHAVSVTQSISHGETWLSSSEKIGRPATRFAIPGEESPTVGRTPPPAFAERDLEQGSPTPHSLRRDDDAPFATAAVPVRRSEDEDEEGRHPYALAFSTPTRK